MRPKDLQYFIVQRGFGSERLLQWSEEPPSIYSRKFSTSLSETKDTLFLLLIFLIYTLKIQLKLSKTSVNVE